MATGIHSTTFIDQLPEKVESMSVPAELTGFENEFNRKTRSIGGTIPISDQRIMWSAVMDENSRHDDSGLYCCAMFTII